MMKIGVKGFGVFMMSVLLPLLVSCGNGNGGGKGVDTTPPTVTSTSPANGAVDVAGNGSISATFSEDMDSTTINTSTFTLSFNPSVPGTVIYNPETKTATFTPSNDLNNNTVYTATVTTAAKDTAGNALIDDHKWTFTTTEAFITPNTGLTTGGTLVTIKGIDLNAVTSVTIGGSLLENFVAVDSTTLTGNTPPGVLGPADVVIIDPSGPTTLSGRFNYQDGIPSQGNALSFDGNDLVTFGTVTPLFQHTIEAWVKPTSVQGENIIVGQIAGPSQACNRGMFLMAGDSAVSYIVDPAGCGAGNSQTHTINTLGVWTHLAGTFDGSVASLFVNGKLVKQLTGVSFDSSNWMTAGAITFFNGQQFFFTGEIDEIRMWNIPRSVQEIRGTMSKPLKGTEQGLVGYWNFNEGSGQNAGDLTSSNVTGVLGTTSNVQSNDPTWITSGAPIFVLGTP